MKKILMALCAVTALSMAPMMASADDLPGVNLNIGGGHIDRDRDHERNKTVIIKKGHDRDRDGDRVRRDRDRDDHKTVIIKRDRD